MMVPIGEPTRDRDCRSAPGVRLFVAGDAPSSRKARNVVNALARDGDEPPIAVEVIDVLQHPEEALSAGLLATPTLIVDDADGPTRFVGDMEGRPDIEHRIAACRHAMASGGSQPTD